MKHYLKKSLHVIKGLAPVAVAGSLLSLTILTTIIVFVR